MSELSKGLTKKVAQSAGLVLIGVIFGINIPYDTSKLEDHRFNQGYTKGSYS